MFLFIEQTNSWCSVYVNYIIYTSKTAKTFQNLCYQDWLTNQVPQSYLQTPFCPCRLANLSPMIGFLYNDTPNTYYTSPAFCFETFYIHFWQFSLVTACTSILISTMKQVLKSHINHSQNFIYNRKKLVVCPSNCLAAGKWAYNFIYLWHGLAMDITWELPHMKQILCHWAT